MTRAAGLRKQLLKAATNLAVEDKFKVFPLVPCSKIPAVEGGLKVATIDTAQIVRWWSQRPWNIGIATGEQSNLVVVDLDGGEAVQWWAEAEHQPTRLVKTTKGFHLYYRYPAGLNIRNSASKIAPGVDIRGNGGYVVAPPSLHKSGNQYTWGKYWNVEPLPAVIAEAAHVEPPPPVPKDFKPRTEPGTSKYGSSVLEKSAEAIATASPGSRNDNLNRKAYVVGMFVAGGEIDEYEARTALVHAGSMAGLDHTEVVRTVDRALQDARTRPRKAPV